MLTMLLLVTAGAISLTITAAPIPLDLLRYWSAEHQEAYASAEAATRRLAGREEKFEFLEDVRQILD